MSEDRRRCWYEWPESDAPLPLSRNQLKEIGFQAARAWGIPEELAEFIAADVGTGSAQLFLRRHEFGEQPPEPHPDALYGRERVQALRSLAGTLRNRGLDADEILACLLVLNDSRCSPPLPDREVAQIARQMGRKAVARPLIAGKIAA